MQQSLFAYCISGKRERDEGGSVTSGQRPRSDDAAARADGGGGDATGSANRPPRFPKTLSAWYGVDAVDVPSDVKRRVDKLLTVKPKHYGIGPAPQAYTLLQETDEVIRNEAEDEEPGQVDAEDGTSRRVIWVPRFFGLTHFGAAERSSCTTGKEMVDVGFAGTLSSAQEDAARTTMSQILTLGGAVMVRKPGGGKTVIGICIACRLRRRTLVVCHTSALVTQWEERIRQFAPSARIGRIQQRKTHVDADFVIAMMQSLCLRDYGPGLLDDIGFTIMDEAHHVPAKTYMTVTKKLKSKYLLALTATPDRKDGLQRLLHYGFGGISHEDPGDTLDRVCVKLVKYGAGPSQMRTTRAGVVDMPNMITDLARDLRRNVAIAKCVAFMYGEGRFCIVLSDRISLLDDLCRILQEPDDGNVPSRDIAYFVGSRTTEADRERAKTRRVILATFHEAREGLDIPRLDGAVFATPISDARQAVGRIQRPNVEKLLPVLYDVVDTTLPCFANMARKREGWYRRVGFDVRHATGEGG